MIEGIYIAHFNEIKDIVEGAMLELKIVLKTIDYPKIIKEWEDKIEHLIITKYFGRYD